MTDIKVPIGRGLTQQIEKFPNIPKSIPEFEKISFVDSTTDLAFLKQIHDGVRLITSEGSRSTDGEMASIVPLNGETFYLLGGKYQIQTTGGGRMELNNDGVIRERYNAEINDIVKGAWVITTDSLRGNGTKAYTVDLFNESGTTAVSGSIFGYVQASPTLSSRGGM